MLVNEGGVTDVEVLCAALLHDTVEDTETTPRGAATTRSARASPRIVAEVTDDKRLPKAERKRLQIEHAGGISARGRSW